MASLINMSNIPGEIISGLSTEDLHFVTSESSTRFVKELDDAFLSELNEISKDLPTLTNEQLEELNRIEADAVPKSTDKQTKQHVNRFKRFLREEGLQENFDTIPHNFLNDYLRLFYTKIRKDDGGLYSPASLICFRASIQRYLSSYAVNKNINILQGEEFKRANGCLKGMVAKFLKANTTKSEKYGRIEENDMRMISDYFAENAANNLSVLQEETIFNILWYFQLRGRENLRQLKRNSFDFSLDSEGKEFCFIRFNMLHKNVKASTSSKDFSDLKQARMYSRPEDPRCPVKSLKEYLTALPETTKEDVLFPLVTKGGKFSSQCVSGKDSLGNLLKRLSKKLGLSKMYVNHCVRVTGINVLHERGMGNEAIAAVTGHKSSVSVQRYIRTSESHLRSASDALASSFCQPSTSGNKRNINESPSESILTKVFVHSDGDQHVSGCSASSEKTVNIYGPFNNCSFSF